ncbi:Mrp/NBP35 family ATP-binding protein [Sulfurimonas autotrophica]|uniref:Iron-sulfur cluster carrier protein n=1 Tax=Sulfurimonas autotrophica (strain ATCC BAA-671 / DSM 16294 / JCM 11897 / OK10) TaxID=563040 RepID=E0UQS9_SULAO|nr:Mrp/NBP35 family ATP-binding protein [Sulfurimonas autotrophica]ADN08810.1 ATPase-like, ParA/MinD [Sulfurimonas autotrophica DSM 16294]
MIKQEIIEDLLKQVIYPGFTKSIVHFDFVREIKIIEKEISITLSIPSTSIEIETQLRDEITTRIKTKTDMPVIVKILKPKMPKETSSNGKNVLPNIQNFVMVSSGKGGVGKSTTTVNLAIALAQQGKRVGLLDADIYGPNIPRMMGIADIQPVFLGKTIKPIPAHNIKVMSIGSLVERGASLIWKGAMVTQAIEQMLEDIEWGELDVLLFDMPPGTGDAQLALAQNLPVTAGVCVTTPQKVALDDTIRSMDMFKNLHIPIAGLVENMSGFICPSTSEEFDIFGKGTTQPLADAYETTVLGEIPIEPAIREGGDSGQPITIIAPNCETSKRYQNISTKLWNYLLKVNEDGGVNNEEIQPTIF